jgi:sugar phosphate isomerase/epimerase
MFKTGIITDQVSMDFEESLKAIREFKIEYIEIHALWWKNIEELTDDELSTVKKLIDKYELKVSNISSTCFLQCDLDDDSKIEIKAFDDYFITVFGDYEQHLKYLEKCIKCCHIFGTDKLRIFGFRKLKKYSNKIIDQIVNKLEKPVNIAKKQGITLILENCPWTYLPNGKLSSEVVKKIDSPNLKVLWDPGNAFVSGTEPYPNDYLKVKDYLGHIHAKDFKRNNKEHTQIFGEGDINYQDLIGSLIESDFQGVLSLEPEHESKIGGRIESCRQCVFGLRDIFKN